MAEGAAQELTLDVIPASLPLRSAASAGLLLEEKGPLAPLCRLANTLVSGYAFSLSDHEQSIGSLRMIPRPDGQWLIESGDAGLLVSRAALFECVEKLAAARMPLEPYWLLRHDALFWRPSPADRRLAAQLETRAANPPSNPILRRALMIEMESAGLFDEAGLVWRMDMLKELECPVLVSYVEAARLAHEYFRSDDRQKLIQATPPPRLLERHVSIEWFRQPHDLPSGVTLFTWTAACEFALLRNQFGDLAEGHVLQRWGSDWYRMHWTRESSVVPALDRVHVLPP